MEAAIKKEYRLFWAAYNGQGEEINALLDSGVSVDADKYNSSPFHRIGDRKTPLQVAAAGYHDDCVRILLNHGADPNAANYAGLTPLMLAAMKGDLYSLKMLLSAGAQCNSVTNATITHPDSSKLIIHSTALHLASAYNEVECVEQLIGFGADCSIQDGWGRTSLYVSCEADFADCVCAHIEIAANKDFVSLCDFRKNYSPLHLVIERELEEYVQLFVDCGVDVNCKNSNGLSPLSLALSRAAYSGYSFRIFRTLLMEGRNADISKVDLSCDPADDYIFSLNTVADFHNRNIACDSQIIRCSKLTKLLLACGARADIMFADFLTLLEYVLLSYHMEFDLLKRIVEVLPRDRLCNYSQLDVPSEFNVEPTSRKIFSRVLMSYLKNLTPPSAGTSQEEIDKMDLISDDPTYAEHLSIFWPPTRVLSDLEAECYIAFHLANRHRVANLSYEDFFSEFYELWKTFCIYQKREWLINLVKNPRSLKEACRYVIRSVLSSNMVEKIKKLDIPRDLQSFLLFFEDMYSSSLEDEEF